MTAVGDARGLTADQNLALQFDALARADSSGVTATSRGMLFSGAT